MTGDGSVPKQDSSLMTPYVDSGKTKLSDMPVIQTADPEKGLRPVSEKVTEKMPTK